MGNHIFGPEVMDMLTAAESASIAVAGAVTVYTKAVSLKYGQYFALAYKATVTSGSPDVKIEIEQSYDLPTTEGSADAKWTEPSTIDDVVASLTDQNWHSQSIYPVPLPYMRLKITGAAGNAASTVLQIKLSKQEEL